MRRGHRSKLADERALATITLGGVLRLADLNPFRRAIERAAAALAVDGTGVDELDLMEAVNRRESLTLHTRRVNRRGGVPILENFCVRHGLTYRRVTRGGGVTDTTEQFWKPGLRLPHVVQINARTGDVLYPMTFLLSLRNHKVNLNDWVLAFQENFPTEIPALELTD